MSATLKLRDYQTEAIDAVFAAWADGMQRPAIVLPTGAGKGHPLDTEIVTPDGLRKWGDLRVGDDVYGSGGTPVMVTAVFDRGTLPAYRVTFSDGSSVVTDPEHIWSVRDAKYRRTSREHTTVTTLDVVDSGVRFGRLWRWRVPVSPTLGDDVPLPVGPYTLGSLVANGHLSSRSGVTLTTPDTEVVDRVRSEHTVTPRPVDTALYCPRYGVTGINRELSRLGLMVNSAEKFIPRVYLESGYDQRVSLLQGLMDGDGSSRGGGRRSVNYHTTSPRLARDVVELVNSLGGTGSISVSDRVQAASGMPYQDIKVSVLMPSEVEPFHSTRKTGRPGPRRDFQPRRSIVSVERVEDQPIRCITVDAEDHLYQVTRSRIVTHNTVVFAHLIQRFRAHGTVAPPGSGRVIVLVHRDELADQAINKIRAVSPDLSVGKVKAADNDVHADVMVCSVQTLAVQRRLNQLRDATAQVNPLMPGAIPGSGPIGLIITDECHHAAAASYQKIYRAFPDALQLGVTATMARGDGVGLGTQWEDVVYSRSILNLISQGYLVDVKAMNVEVAGLDLGSVKRSRGDYQAGDLGAAMEESGAQYAIAGAYKEHAADRRGIVFTPTVATAELTAASLTLAGIPAAAISGETPREERRSIFESFRLGETQVLVNCMVLTEGFDAPWASCAVIARPTQSQPLYVQMVGRVLRPWAEGGKRDALVLNMNGAGGKLSTLIDLEPGVVESVREGETLTEAVEREEKEGQSRITSGHPAFGLTFKEVDLFAASHSNWLATRKGVRFLSAGEFTFFLWPSKLEPGTWDVCWMEKGGDAHRTAHCGLGLDMAMSWGEAEAENYGAFSVDRKASWRRGKPSEAQLGYALMLGIDAYGMNKAELSDAISIAKESRRLDRHVK